jgi:hypothetical protein
VSSNRSAEESVRWEVVARVRQLIAAGAYDTPERFAAAFDRLVTRLEADELV